MPEVPDDAPAPLSVDPADLTADDHRALADLAAGRLIDSETITQRLGGWQIARFDTFADGPDGFSAVNRPVIILPADAPPNAAPVLWTLTAAAACDRIRHLLSAFGEQGERRFTAALVATMVRLIVDGVHTSDGIVDLPLLPPITLRILIDRDRLTVLGLRERATIR